MYDYPIVRVSIYSYTCMYKGDTYMFKGYTPYIPDIGTDSEITDRLNSDSDSFPYVAPYTEDVSAEETFETLDRVLCRCMYHGQTLGQCVSTYMQYEKDLSKYGYTPHLQALSTQLFNRRIDSGLEALSETAIVISKIYSKLSEYINTVRMAMVKYFATVADIQKRVNDHIEKQIHSKNLSDSKYQSILLDVHQGQCPTAESLEKCLVSINQLFKELNIKEEKNPIVIFVNTFIQTLDTDPDKMDIQKLQDSNLIFGNLSALQELFQNSGIVFDGTETANFTDVSESRQDTLSALGYTQEVVKKLHSLCPTKETIQECSKITVLLDNFHKKFTLATKALEKSNKDISIEKVKEIKSLMTVIPNVLSLVTSIYRCLIVATRYYTTMISDILDTVSSQHV